MTELQQFDGWYLLTPEQVGLMRKESVLVWQRMNEFFVRGEISERWKQEAYREILNASGFSNFHVMELSFNSGLRCFCVCPKMMSESEYQAMLSGLMDAEDTQTPDAMLAALNRETARVLQERDR